MVVVYFNDLIEFIKQWKVVVGLCYDCYVVSILNLLNLVNMLVLVKIIVLLYVQQSVNFVSMCLGGIW